MLLQKYCAHRVDLKAARPSNLPSPELRGALCRPVPWRAAGPGKPSPQLSRRPAGGVMRYSPAGGSCGAPRGSRSRRPRSGSRENTPTRRGVGGLRGRRPAANAYGEGGGAPAETRPCRGAPAGFPGRALASPGPSRH